MDEEQQPDPDEVARKAAEYGLTVDEYLQELAEDRIAMLGWQKLTREFEAEHGAFTEEEPAEARAWWESAKAELREAEAQDAARRQAEQRDTEDDRQAS